MANEFKLPQKKAVVFWPVGTGDSTTLVLRPSELVMQIDLHHMEKSDDPDESSWPVIDHLVRTLPKRNGRPYLAVFALTHPDQDHCRGFAELNRRVSIGELWHTPKVFRTVDDEQKLCEDAKAFRAEAHRRRKAILKNPASVPSGDRLRVIGHDDVLNEDNYKGLPETAKSRPGHKVSLVDGVDLTGHFEAFIHAPFSSNQDESRNDTSLSLNVSLIDGASRARFFFFGDLGYLTIKRIFETTKASGKNERHLEWHVMLASHHCSKSVMYWADEGEDEKTLRSDIMTLFESYAQQGAVIVSSSTSDFSDEEGANPPHKKARRQYEAVVDAGNFVCTHEFPSRNAPVPVVFEISAAGVTFSDPRKKAAVAAGLAAATAAARGSNQPTSSQVTLGRKR
jgi:hypothetical protein